MASDTRQILKNIVTDFGRRVLEEPDRLAGLLAFSRSLPGGTEGARVESDDALYLPDRVRVWRRSSFSRRRVFHAEGRY